MQMYICIRWVNLAVQVQNIPLGFMINEFNKLSRIK